MTPFVLISILYSMNFYYLWVPDSVGIAASQPSQIFSLLACASYVFAISLPLGQVIASAELHKQLAFACLAEAALNLLLSIAFGFLFGKIGIAVATLIACLTIHLPSRLWLCHKATKTPLLLLLSSFVKPSYCLLCFTPTLLTIKYLLPSESWTSLIISGFSGISAWALVAIAIGLTPKERLTLRTKLIPPK
ncbi:polysaccharide biosynthesis C-terminal domain-containing protein, partial [Rhodopirellula sp.]|nr:polysaccharide biosynthesis C-terminal domain-containing protein [Rhodopirellula sp.]